MKALFLHDGSSGNWFPRMGQARVLQALGWEVLFWNPQAKPALDVFAEFGPVDLFMSQTYNLDRAQIKAIAHNPQMKVCLYASAWGPLVDGIDRKQFPIVFVNEQEKRAVSTLKELTGKPDFVHLHLADRYVEGVLGGWSSIGANPIGLLNGADTFAYSGGRPRKEYQCDLGYIGGKWGYKSRNIDRYLIPLCHPSSGLRVKIWGNQPWGCIPQYLGNIDEDQVKDVFASAIVCPNVSEPHSTDLDIGDIVERNYKVPLAGGFLVSDHVESLVKDAFPAEEVPTGRSPQEFHQLICHYIAHPDERLPLMRSQKDRVIREHTYFHRVEKLFTALGMSEWVSKTKSLYESLVLQPYLEEIGQ